jgi:hypothetical protein
VAAAFGFFVVVCIGFAIYFMAAPVEPFAFFKDLGFNWEVIDWATHRIHSPVDALDTVGWSPWFLGPLYFLNSYLGDLPGVFVAAIVGNAWLAVKIVEVLQTIVAAGGAYAFYSSSSKSMTWRIAFAVAYAALPETALTIRWNADFGWIVALAPGCLALSKWLIRKFGARAFPMVGVVSAYGGYLLAIQFLVFTSLPLFVLAAANRPRRLANRVQASLLVLGIGCCVASGAFFVLPSFVHPLVADSAPRYVSLATGAFLSNFSLDWLGLLTLVEREWAVSPISDYNVSTSLPWLIIPSGVLWILAILHLARARNRRQTYSDPISVAVVAACTILALGTTLPFGDALWTLLYRIPHMNAVRTADRFFTLVPMMVLYWATCGCEEFFRRSRRLSRVAAYAILAVCVTNATFDRAQHSFSLDYSKGEREPDIDAVRDVVVRDDVPVASFATVNGGATEDAPTYGRPQPVSWATTDLGSRFVEDGIGASGVLGRAGIGDVVSSPPWTYDQPGRPNVSNIYRELPRASIAFSSPEDVLVSRIVRRSDVSATHLICVTGGPGPFDLMYADPAFTDFSFDTQAQDCRETGYVNAVPVDDWRSAHPIDAWSGSDLSVSGSPLLDVDYPLLYNRTLLNIPWYRNAVDGERPEFDAGGAVRFQFADHMPIAKHHSWPAQSKLFLRIDAHDPATVSLEVGGRIAGSVHVERGLGFHWFVIPIRASVPADAVVDLELAPNLSTPSGDTWPGVVLDGAAVFDRPVTPAHEKPTRFVVASLADFHEMASSETTDVEAVGTNSSLLTPIPDATSMALENVSGAPAYVVTGQQSRVRFRWTGPPGRFAIDVSAVLADASTSLGASTSNDGCCDVYGQTVPGQKTEFAFQRTLRTGDVFEVAVTSAHFDSADGDRVTSIRLRATQPLLLTAPHIFRPPETIDFRDPADALPDVQKASGIEFSPGGARGTGRSSIQLFVVPIGRNVTVHAQTAMHDIAAGNAGYANLQCGSNHESRPLAEVVDLRVTSAESKTCRLSLTWNGAATLSTVQFDAEGTDQIGAATTDLWIPAGRYRLSVLRNDGTRSDPQFIAIDGCRADLCRFAHSGTHRAVAMRRAPGDALLVLISRGAEKEPPPIEARQTNALRWRVVVTAKTDLAFTQLFDGNWTLAGGVYRSVGTPCDIADTCFADVPPGTYTLVHRWPAQLWAGVVLTALTFAGAVFLLRSRRATTPNAA